MTSIESKSAALISGRLRVPGDKSISHRAVMLGALAEGTTRITGFLEGEDTRATLAAFKEMGVSHAREGGALTIRGVGMHGLQPPSGPIDMHNSGTGMRLLCGILAAQPFASTIVGDRSLTRRPMRRVVAPLSQMGAHFETAEHGRPPLQIKPAQLRGIDCQLSVASAQVKSAILLAGLYANGKTCVDEPQLTRDHTERMLRSFGCPVHVDGPRVCLVGGAKLSASDVRVPADISSAAFHLVAALLRPGSNLILDEVGINPRRIGVLEILRQMGATIEIKNRRHFGDEPVADLHVRHSILQGVVIPQELIPSAIDEFPVLFVTAALAGGRTVLRGAAELRVKESDRISVMAAGLRKLGAVVEEFDDGLAIEGSVLRGGEVESAGDHRCAMAFAAAGMAATAPVRVNDCANVATSYPGFVEQANSVGANIQCL